MGGGTVPSSGRSLHLRTGRNHVAHTLTEAQFRSALRRRASRPGGPLSTIAAEEARPTSSAEPLLSLRGVNKSFGPAHVLRGVDLDVPPGKVTALVGDNGGGKSTLIKGIAGIHSFDSGEYTFEGNPVTIHDPRKANDLGIEVVYQDLALSDNLDVVANMYLGRELRGGVVLDEI